MADLSSLPPPPPGQQGVSFDDLKSLPPPPAGQTGLTLDQAQQQAPVAPAPSGPDFLDTASKIAGSILPGKQVGEAIGTLGGYGVAAFTDFLNHLHGNPTTLAKNYDLNAPSPLQTTGDVAKGAAVVGSLVAPTPATFLSAAGQGAALGATAGAGEAATKTSGEAIPTAEDALKTAEGTAAGGAIGAGSGAAVFGIGKLIGALGDKITSSVIKPTQRDIKDGYSVDTIKKYNLGGSLSDMYNNTEAKLSELSKKLNKRLASSPSAVDLSQVYKDTAKSLSANKAQGFGSNTSISSALEQLQNEIHALDNHQVSIPQAQLVKQATGKVGAWQYGVQDPAATAREKVYNTFYSHLKTAIEQNSPPGVKAINKQISELIPVQNAIVRRIPVAERNNALSLTDMVGLVGSAMNPHALAGLGISLAQKSGTVGHLLSRFAAPAIQRGATPLASGAASLGSELLGGAGNTKQ